MSQASRAVYSAHIPIVLTLLSPLHHGAGTSGNTQLLRVEEITLPDGTGAMVPFVSGNSVRHAIRAACAELLLDRAGAQPGSLPKPVVDLLYSGGALTAGSGANVDLDAFRRLDGAWPASGMLGYASKANIWAGTLFVDHVHVVCAENGWRLPAHLAGHPHATLPAAQLRGEAFGTRHDPVGTAADRWLDTDLWTGQSNQMIFDWQIVTAGTVWWTTLHLAAATPGHVHALHEAWTHLTADGALRLGAKRAQGYGLARVDSIDWQGLDAVAATYTPQTGVDHLALLAEAA